MTLERDFTSWVDGRDADALGRVFDGTAGRLLLLAEHLVGGHRGGPGAEDLVQETFLLAMDRCATWDRGQPMWPWLAAILHNRAHHHFRQRQRRRESDERALDGMVSDEPRVEALAESKEAVAAIVAAIDALPLPYRQVLRLRLVHGLRAVEIARALEQPVGTVRAQLSRGRALLRPRLSGVLGAVLAARLMAAEPGLAAVRMAVIARAGRPAGPLTATQVAGVSAGVGSLVAMKTKWMLGGLVAALLLLAYYLLPLPGAPTASPGLDAPAVGSVEVGGFDAPEPARSVARVEAREWPEPAWGMVVTVTNGDGNVVPSAAVTVSWGPRSGTGRDRHYRELALGETDGRGEFRCSLDGLRPLSNLVRRTSMIEVAARAGGIERFGFFDLPDTDAGATVRAEVELGELGSDRACLSGRVVDVEGRHVEAARISWGSAVSLVRVRSDHRGGFVMALPDGASEIVVSHPAHGIKTRAVPDRPDARSGVVDLGEIVLPLPDPRRCVTGRVVLGDGRGAAEVEVLVLPIPDRAGDEAAAEGADAVAKRQVYGDTKPEELELRGDRVVRNTGVVRTGAGGAFCFAGLEPGADYVVAVRDSTLRHHARFASAGGAAVDLVVEVQELRIEVQDTRRAALPGARLLCEVFADREGVLRRIGSVWPGLLSDGCQRLLVPFGVVLRIRPADDFARASVLEHYVLAGVARAHHECLLQEVGPTGAVRIVVVDEGGEPCTEYHFELRGLDRVASYSGFGPGDATVEDMSPGRWAAKVLMGMSGPGTHDVAARGVHEEEVLVVGGRTTELRVVAPASGSVVFRPRSSTGGALTGLQCTGVDGQPLELRTRRFHGFVELETVERGGEVIVERAFAPGRRAFTVTADGHEPATFTVDIEVNRWATASPVLRVTGR